MSPDPDRLTGAPSHGYAASCVKKSSKFSFLSYAHANRQKERQTDPKLPSHFPLGDVIININNVKHLAVYPGNKTCSKVLQI